MSKIKYDNALTMLDEEKSFMMTVDKLVETIDKINYINSNKFLNESDNILLESLWEKVKYYLSKLGRYKAGGKVFGKGKVDKEATTKIQAILDKKGNEIIKQLNDKIKQENPEFPNNEKGEEFLKTVMEIAVIYDSVIEATKKDPEDKGYLPTDVANNIIADLAEYVKKFIDVDLNFMYTVTDSEEEKSGHDDNVLLTNSVEDVNEDDAADVRKKLSSKSGDTKYDTKRMGKEGLKSNRLPILLSSIGAALGAFSWLVNTEWFKSLFQQTFEYTDTEQITDVIETKTEVLNDIKPGEGLYVGLSRVTEIQVNASSDPQLFIDQLSQIGGGDPHKGIDLLCEKGGWMMRPDEASKGLHDLVNNPDQYNNMGDFFKGSASGTGKLVDPNSGLDTTLYGTKAGTFLKSILVKQLPVIITKVVTKTAIKTGATYYTAKGLGNILGPLGLTLVLTGLTVKVLREKGQRQSRAKTLNDLLQSLRDIEPSKENQPVIDEPTGGEEQPTGTDEPTGGEEQPTGTDEPTGAEEQPTGTDIPADFLKGNRNMQLVYLSQNFLPGGKSLWYRLGLKEGTVLPTGFFDAALGQGKVDQEKYLNAFYKHLVKEGSFTKKLNVGAWLTKVQSSENQSLIKWVRNTRKSIGGFIGAIKKAFPDFGIGERRKAKTKRPGERGKAMALAGESIMGKNNLLIEIGLGGTASKAGFDEKEFMKNLPQFMEMLSMMYYDGSGKKLPYDKEEVLTTCKKFGCKAGSSKKYKKTKSDDYEFMMSDKLINEEIKRIRQLMK
jgi:hypothetical protein